MHLLLDCIFVRVGGENCDVICICNEFILLLSGVGMSDVYILKSVGESTPPCGTLVFIVACLILCCCIVCTVCVSKCSLMEIL